MLPFFFVKILQYFYRMRQALQILFHKGIINGEQHLLPLKNKI